MFISGTFFSHLKQRLTAKPHRQATNGAKRRFDRDLTPALVLLQRWRSTFFFRSTYKHDYARITNVSLLDNGIGRGSCRE